MKVLVKISGFYGGTWHEAGDKPVEIADAIAKPFMAPYGDQLAVPVKKTADKPAKAD
jgi:hypothetical protein